MNLWISDLDVVVDEVYGGEYFLAKGLVIKIARCLQGNMDNLCLQALEQPFKVVGIEGTFTAGKGYSTTRVPVKGKVSQENFGKGLYGIV